MHIRDGGCIQIIYKVLAQLGPSPGIFSATHALRMVYTLLIESIHAMIS